MSGKFCAGAAGTLTVVLVMADCRRADDPPPPLEPVIRQMAAWEGTGSQSLELVSQSGRFRIRWQTRPEPDRDPVTGTFTLTVHSGVSGRPLQEVVNQRGPGEGAFNFEDDPRPYNLMVESAGLAWSIAVDETVLVKPPPDERDP